MSNLHSVNPIELPVLPLRDVIVYPNVIIPLLVGRIKSVRAVEQAMKRQDKKILLLAQKNPTVEEPTTKEVYRIGTVCRILQLLKLPGGTLKILVEGEDRAVVEELFFEADCLCAVVDVRTHSRQEIKECESSIHVALSLFEQYLQYHKNIPQDVISALVDVKDPGRVADVIAAHLPLKLVDKQTLLSLLEGDERLKKLNIFLKKAIELSGVEQKLSDRVHKQMKDNQRTYYLNEQMRAIQKELGDEGEEEEDDIQTLIKEIKRSGMSKEAHAKAEIELKKLKMMPPISAEATVSRNYLDCLIRVPWAKRSKVNTDLARAESILNKDHYGLEKIKERIIEYLAVQSRVSRLKGPILCLVGAPGVGKTSLGQSIARATGRKFVRMSLGGVRDEAEIRGHRRTYIGALPGKIVQNLTKTGVRNPLFLLDEVDKMAADFRGDPAAALLEVLDPEQNHTFNDHYLEVDYDLSEVMFIATANTLDIPPALLDRMELIFLSGYTEEEKIHIARRHLMSKQLKLNGLKSSELVINDDMFQRITRCYTREAGVRSLERALSKICRKVVKAILSSPKIKSVVITSDNLEDYLGVPHYRFDEIDKENRVGQAIGLAWTEVGGELLTVEAVSMPGKGNVTITGQLGDVMQESIKAAVSIVRNRGDQLGIDNDFFEKHDIHVHVPEGGIPKEGPSAGITMCTTLVSMSTNVPIRADLAMTGEITLRGEVLPIGGLKEKLLAARRGHIKHVIIPEENIKDLKDIPEHVKRELEIHPVRWIDQVLELALLKKLPDLSTAESIIPPTSLLKTKKQFPLEEVTKTAH